MDGWRSSPRIMPRRCGDAVQGHDHIWTYMSSYGPFADGKTFTDWVASRVALEDPYSYAVIDPSGAAVGIATLMEIRPGGTLGRGRAHRLFAGACSARRSAPRCNTCSRATPSRRSAIAATNGNAMRSTPPSRRAALRYGFVFEGVLRQHTIAKGRSRDTAYYSMLDSEWPARKAAFERWLAPDNFDAQGRQKVEPERAEPRRGAAKMDRARTRQPSPAGVRDRHRGAARGRIRADPRRRSTPAT